jgi:hypothetical protein
LDIIDKDRVFQPGEQTMVNIAASMTQVLTNSPQVTALVAGEAGAVDQIKRQKQIEESRRFQEEARSKVLSTERSLRPDESEEETRRRLEERNKHRAVSERREGRGRSRASERAGREAEPSSAVAVQSPFETRQVIDLCV